jgi:hypothetical protein
MRFLSVFLAATALFAAAYAGLVRGIDPRGDFGGGAFPVVGLDARADKMRLFRAYAAEAPPRGLILGSSRAMKVSPSTLQEATGRRFFNFAVDNARAEDYLAIYRWVRRQGVRLELLVVGLDVEALHDDDRPEPGLLRARDLVDALGEARPAEPGLLAPLRSFRAARAVKTYKSTFTFEYAADMLQSVRFRLHPGSAPVPMMAFEPDGYLRYRRWEMERAAGSFRFERDLDRCLAKSVGRFEHMTALSERRREHLRRLLEEAESDGTRTIVFISSLHPLTARHLEARTRYADLLAATRRYAQELSSRHVTADYDFSDPERYGGTDSGFYDCLHVDESNAQRMIAALDTVGR